MGAFERGGASVEREAIGEAGGAGQGFDESQKDTLVSSAPRARRSSGPLRLS